MKLSDLPTWLYSLTSFIIVAQHASVESSRETSQSYKLGRHVQPCQIRRTGRVYVYPIYSPDTLTSWVTSRLTTLTLTPLVTSTLTSLTLSILAPTLTLTSCTDAANLGIKTLAAWGIWGESLDTWEVDTLVLACLKLRLT